MNNEKISGFKRNHAGGDEKLVVNKCWPKQCKVCILANYVLVISKLQCKVCILANYVLVS